MVMNIEVALANVEGDQELLLELAALFCEESPKCLAALRQATARRDFDAVRTAAHGFKGSVGTFAAQDAMEAAVRLEGLARGNEADGVPEASAALQAKIEELRSALQLLSSDPRLVREPCLGCDPPTQRHAVPGKVRR
jgi:two-component system sensor histidine kinase/response regulator